ncbi:MAG: hypothetical protein KA221_11450, partial [Vitreoscilla sp.]|nr:hypothetical protein [Vitreoscilla sp.]
ASSLGQLFALLKSICQVSKKWCVIHTFNAACKAAFLNPYLPKLASGYGTVYKVLIIQEKIPAA